MIINQMWGWAGWTALVLVLSSCVAQQAELVDLERRLEKKIALGKKALEKTIDKDKVETNEKLGKIKNEVKTQLRNDRARFNHDLK
ncbi:MAG: hypothetical protein VST66_03740, partial [Nitrospirota bacterium]|nr:hypothetical protein [Nitrospirota bacterium]